VQWIRNGEKYAMKKLNLFGQEELIILQHKVKIVQNLQKKTGHNGFTTIYGDKCIPAPRPNEYHYYIIMELVEKDWEVELKRRRMNSEFYTEYELLNIVKQLVKTLSIMQQNNVTHRDIKPQNVLIKGGFYKLCDFDEVKIIYNQQPCMHSVRGSELYMSPILFYAYQKKTPSIVHNTYKSDVFSLGMCILLAAGLTAKTLCDIREIKDMNIISEIIISRLFNRYSPNFIKLIIKMLQLEETLRFDFIELEEYILQIWPN
jgi:serine/threonine protein kinase